MLAKCLNCDSSNITIRKGNLIFEDKQLRTKYDHHKDKIYKHYRCSDCQSGWIQKMDDKSTFLANVNF